MKSYFAVFCCVMLFVTVTFTFSIAQTNWTKDNLNSPVLVPGTSGTWNDISWYPFCLLWDDTAHHIWGGGNDGTNVHIGYFSSQNGITGWTEYDANPVLSEGAPGSWEDELILSPYVLFDNNMYHMWYAGYDRTNSRIGYATSADKVTWTKYASNPVMDTGSSGSWESTEVLDPCVYFDGNTYHMWYAGYDGANICIGYATSTDKVTWIRYAGNPVLCGDSGEWDGRNISAPEVFFDGTTYHMWYNGTALSSGRYFRIGYATSPDGINWTKYANNPVMDNGPAESWDSQWVGYMRVLFDSVDAQYKMWFGGGRDNVVGKVGYATAPLNLNVPDNFATIQEAIDAAHDGNVVLVDEGTYYENINFKGKAITVASHFYLDGDTSHINNTIIDGSQPSNPDSGSVVYFISGEDTSSVLMGFTITGGTGTIVSWDNELVRYGGGIHANTGAATIFRNKITDNHITYSGIAAAAGIGIKDITLTYAIIDYNQIMNNTVNGNSFLTFGGGIDFINSSGKITRNKISYNSCTSAEGQAIGTGISVYREDIPERPFIIIENNMISHNSASGVDISEFYPGGIGGGIRLEGSNALVKNNNIVHNEITGTGYSSGAALVMVDVENLTQIDVNTIAFNHVTDEHGKGGGIFFYNARPVITNNIIHDNYAANGGGIYSWSSATPQIINNTIVNNNAVTGGGIHSESSSLVILNTIVWGNSADNVPGISRNLGTVMAHYSDIQDGDYMGDNNLSEDPIWIPWNIFHLTHISPCRGAGVDSIEILFSWYTCPPFDVYNRPRNDTIDIGAIQFNIIDPIAEYKPLRPSNFNLRQNYPNPFNPITNIEYQVRAYRDTPQHVELTIYNLLGQKVTTLVSQPQVAGKYQVEWDGSAYASGIYFYQLTAGDYKQLKKMVLLK